LDILKVKTVMHKAHRYSKLHFKKMNLIKLENSIKTWLPYWKNLKV